MKTLVTFLLAASLVAVTGCNKNDASDANGAQEAEAHAEETAEDATEEAADAEDDVNDAADEHVLDVALLEKEWPITHLNGEALETENDVTISFDQESRIAGSGGCNRFMGDYKILENNEIEITLGGSTMMMCDEATMAVEQQIHELLPTISQYSFDEETGALTLTTTDGHTLSGE